MTRVGYSNPYRRTYVEHSNLYRSASCIVLSVFAAGANAQTQSAGTLAPVVIQGNYDNAVGTSDAASQGSVTAKLIASRPTQRTGEILEFVPGLIVTQHSGDGKANQYFLRGFNLDHGTDFATFVDGMPVNMPTHAHGQGYSDLNFLIPELVQRIDYRKGPYFAEEGDFASAGSARLKLYDKLPQGIASLSLGSNKYARTLLANSTDLGSGSLLYALEAGHNDGPWLSPENFRKFSGVLRYSSGNLDRGYNITAMVYQARWNSTDQIPQRAVTAGLLNRFGALDPSDGGDTARYSLSYGMHQRNFNGAGLLEFNAYAVRSRLELFSNFTFFQDDPVNGDQFQQTERRGVLGANLAQTWSGQLGELDTATKIGLQTRYDRLDPVGLYSTVNRQRLSTTREDRVRQTSAGIYAENTTQWLEKMRTIAGLRYDRYHFDVASNIAQNSGKKNDSLVSPKLSFVIGPWAQTEYFLNYGEGFHSNHARGTTATIGPKSDLLIDPVVPLVKTRGTELGVRTEIFSGLQSSLSVWQLKLGSELVFIGDAGDTEASRASKRHGIEWNNHYKLNDWLLIDADFAVSRARFTQFDPVGQRIPGSIDKVASVGFTVTDYKGWFGGMQLRYFGPRPLIEDNSVRSQSTVLTNARIGYQIDKKTRVTLDVFNLFKRKASDIDYFYSSQLAGEAAPVHDIHFHPVEPRSARLSVAYNF